jgi:hypothetical protein
MMASVVEPEQELGVEMTACFLLVPVARTSEV